MPEYAVLFRSFLFLPSILSFFAS
uniref:Uncharacterized protein n=1 Tax=Arundo donax TaxID=35708 RepID=A0A0A9AYQ3_ARUDO